MLNHEPHESHERWRGVGASVPFAGPPSDPRLRRALGTCPQGCPSPETALQASLRRRLRLGHDQMAQTGVETPPLFPGLRLPPSTSRFPEWSRMPVSKQGSVEQARSQSRDLHSSSGRRMPDGRVSVRVRWCHSCNKTTTTATALSWVWCGWWSPSDLP